MHSFNSIWAGSQNICWERKINLTQACSTEWLQGLPRPGDSMGWPRARQTPLLAGPGAASWTQRVYQGASCPARLKLLLLLLLFSHQRARGRGGRGYSIMKGYSLLKRRRRQRRGCRKRGVEWKHRSTALMFLWTCVDKWDFLKDISSQTGNQNFTK